MRRPGLTVFVALFGLLATSSPAEAQWVFVARKVLGRVQHMTQSQDAGAQGKPQPGYDVATVILDAEAQRVYQTAAAMIAANKQVKLVRQDPANLRVEFSHGPLLASMSVTPLGRDLSQLIIASNTAPGPASATSRVLDGVLNVCRQMHKTCTVGGG